MSRKDKIVTVALLLGAVGLGLLNVFLVPPFMNPDEIQHYMYAAENAYSQKELKKIDNEVLQLLKDYNWFHLIGIGPGWERISGLDKVHFINRFTRDRKTVSRSYFHFIYGKLLQASGVRDVLSGFYLLRLVSFLIFLGIFAVSLWFYRGYFPHLWVFLGLGQLLVFQLATIMNAVNYDVLLTLLGVLFFAMGYRFLQSGDRRLIIALPILAALAALVKTAGLLFFAYFFFLLLFRFQVDLKMLKRLGLALLVFALVFGWFNYFFPERFFNLYSVVFYKLRELTGGVNGNGGGLLSLTFFDSILESFYFYTGWMGFKLGSGWYIILRLFLLVSFLGVSASIWKKRDTEGKWLLYGLIVLVLQLLSIRFYYGGGLMAQGRYIFPLLIPIMTVIYLGFHYWESKYSLRRPYLTVSFLIFQVIFVLFAIIRMVSVFYLEVASPHLGL